MTGLEYLLNGEVDGLPSRLAFFEALHGPLTASAILCRSRNQVRDLLAMSGYGDSLSVLDRPKQLGQAHLASVA